MRAGVRACALLRVVCVAGVVGPIAVGGVCVAVHCVGGVGVVARECSLGNVAGGSVHVGDGGEVVARSGCRCGAGVFSLCYPFSCLFFIFSRFFVCSRALNTPNYCDNFVDHLGRRIFTTSLCDPRILVSPDGTHIYRPC